MDATKVGAHWVVRRAKGESEFGSGVRESERLLKEVTIPFGLPQP